MATNMNPMNRPLFQNHRFILRDKDLTEKGAFYLFPLFPMEIQKMIWVLSLTPRLVEVQYYAEVADETGKKGILAYTEDFDSSWEIHYYSIAPLPASFYVSKESRDAVINRYTLCFASETSPAAIYFNFDIDTLFLDKHFHAVGTRFMGCLTDTERHSIIKLAVDEYVLEGNLYGPPISKDEMAVFNMELLSLPKVTDLTLTTSVWQAYKENNDGTPKEEIFDSEYCDFALDNLFFDVSNLAEMYEYFPAEIMDNKESGLEEVPNIWLMWTSKIIRALVKQHAPKRAWIWRRDLPPASV